MIYNLVDPLCLCWVRLYKISFERLIKLHRLENKMKKIFIYLFIILFQNNLLIIMTCTYQIWSKYKEKIIS